jgi:DnaJ-class molecular chaperone
MHNVKKSTNRGFEQPRLDLIKCPTCKGRAVVEGVFFELACTDCNGSGWVVEGSRLVLSLEHLVTQLSFKLQAAEREIKQMKRPSVMQGPEQHYQGSNRRGAGGSNFTGD